MKIVLTEEQKLLIESIEVICDECSHSWKLKEGGDDPFICHNCGHDNEEKD